MKKTFILFIFSIVLITQYATAITQSSAAINDIPLKKDDVQPQPRREPLETFTASYNSETIIIESSDYTGNVQVIITGDNGLTYSYSVSGSNTEYVDISSLGEGSYTLTITTSGNTYSGIFQLLTYNL